MSTNQAVLNRIWSQTILEELSRLGVCDICVAPGSRSTPLTLEAAANPKLTMHTHFDERGLGFLALGLAKSSQRPVAVVVTSGTAVANLLPAIAESHLTGEKLVVLTADRPVELVGCGANQAIDQQGIYSSHVTAALNLPTPALHTPLKWLLTSIDQVMQKQAQDSGSIHINCPFPEPLYSSESKSIFQHYLDTVSHWWQSNQPYCQRILAESGQFFDTASFADKKGLLIVGSVSIEEAKRVQQLANEAGWPLLCDPQSGISSEWAHFDLWLQRQEWADKLNECDLVVQFGSRLVSKRLNHWLKQRVENSDCEYHYIEHAHGRNNQDHLPQYHHVCDIQQWLAANDNWQQGVTTRGWADDLRKVASATLSTAKTMLADESSLSEAVLALSLANVPPHAQLFIGNSLFVRLTDMFSRLPGRAVYSNRGASGIDGLIATASGVVRHTKVPTLVVVGDTSLLYDLNSLALFTHEPTPTVIVVTNNDGGAIFDLLPVPNVQKQALYQMPHGYQFAGAANQFQIPYRCPQTLDECSSMIEQHLGTGHGPLLIEVMTPPEQASNHIKQVVRHLHAL
ncbi:2-succinyl-5-enolpyruvyl-6-hydroxy-3-cyclohexene-1-carboxylic-acid synthase [Vibrio sp. TRT 21S02]|uniref:2-succinyl-5-enolpyruvyl-6-hydroxy-3- cyclohexene-1-carboxylic-acid synthase n=1 Tax=Vibrio sp. TRT 21S02 TaxID=3418507 RepID=UPI003CF640AF